MRIVGDEIGDQHPVVRKPSVARKGQFNLATLDLKDTATPTVWKTALSAQ
jgi:hypothetical protein